jgi:hypothetical protein
MVACALCIVVCALYIVRDMVECALQYDVWGRRCTAARAESAAPLLAAHLLLLAAG